MSEIKKWVNKLLGVSQIFETNDIFKNEFKNAESFYEEIEPEFWINYDNRNTNPKNFEAWQKTINLDPELSKLIGIYALIKVIIDPSDFIRNPFRIKVYKELFLNKIEESKKEYFTLIFDTIEKLKINFVPSYVITSTIEFYIQKFGFDFEIEKIIKKIDQKAREADYLNSDSKKFIAFIGNLSSEKSEYNFDKKDLFGKHLVEIINNFSQDSIKVINFCWTETPKSQPSKTFIKQCQTIIANSKDSEKQIIDFIALFKLLIKIGTETTKKLNLIASGLNENYESEESHIYNDYHKNKGKYFLDETNKDGISNLIWYCGLLQNQNLNNEIVNLAITSFTKIKMIGNLSDKIGNACLYTFSIMPNETGIFNLIKIRNKSVNKNVINVANKYINKKAEELNLAEDDLVELITPTYNIENNKIKRNFGADFRGEINTNDLRNLKIEWINTQKNEYQKSIPKQVSTEYKVELKEFQNELKNLEVAYQIHKTRLENTYLSNKSWEFKNWKTKYIDHPFLSYFNKTIIWFFDDSVTAIFKNNFWVNENNQKIELDNFKSVKVWHPIYSSASTVLNWRNFLFDTELKQPFKQAFREIYKITDAELRTETYSNRFAAHFMNQHQFIALCKQRSWDYRIQGAFDSMNYPEKKITAFEMKTKFWLTAVEDSVNEMGIFNHLSSDSLRFYKNNQLVQINEVPEIVFTEIMRDVDLFIGVTSIGNNHEWQDGSLFNNYWYNYTFGDLSTTADTRKQVLERILPKLKIAKVSSIEGKFLIINGKIRKYKIHLGSGNILMYPNDEYLCIVSDGLKVENKIYLPFEDDRILSLILSKAFLLADDDKITDKTITRQIK